MNNACTLVDAGRELAKIVRQYDLTEFLNAEHYPTEESKLQARIDQALLNTILLDLLDRSATPFFPDLEQSARQLAEIVRDYALRDGVSDLTTELDTVEEQTACYIDLIRLDDSLEMLR